MNGSLGSPAVQAVLLVLGGLFLLWEIWAGWRRGVVRAVLHFAAFVLSGLVGFLAGQAVAYVAERIMPGYGVFLGLVVGAVLTLGILALALLLSALLFKKTSQQPPGGVRLLYGLGGAFFGLLTGLFILWGAVSIIRGAGALAQSSVAQRADGEMPPATRQLIKLKDSLELGPAGQVVESVDVISPENYDLLGRVGRLLNDEQAMMRFIDYPGVQKIMQHRTMAALVEDPDIVDAAQHRDLIRLAGNPKIVKALTDPELSQLVTGLDLQKALDYALPPAHPSPSPQP